MKEKSFKNSNIESNNCKDKNNPPVKRESADDWLHAAQTLKAWSAALFSTVVHILIGGNDCCRNELKAIRHVVGKRNVTDILIEDVKVVSS